MALSEGRAERPGSPEPERADSAPGELERAVHDLTDVLLAVAQGDFEARVERDYSGDAVDVLAFLVNSTADEVGQLVRELKAEQKELQRARDQLVLNAKLAALGGLAAGVAHELNQPLTAVQMLLDIVRMSPDDRIADREADLETIAEATRRMGRIVDGIRTFGRSGVHHVGPVPAGRPLADAVDLLSESFQREGIGVECAVDEALPEITADGDRLHQVFVNLLINARDALRDDPRRQDRRVMTAARVTPDCVIYVVEDNGPGISPDVGAHIFDLFFTTKEVGQGTGLGLSVSHGIVADHGGRLYYEDVREGGVRFIIELPRHGQPRTEQRE